MDINKYLDEMLEEYQLGEKAFKPAGYPIPDRTPKLISAIEVAIAYIKDVEAVTPTEAFRKDKVLRTIATILEP
jgi:hypothetical protein